MRAARSLAVVVRNLREARQTATALMLLPLLDRLLDHVPLPTVAKVLGVEFGNERPVATAEYELGPDRSAVRSVDRAIRLLSLSRGPCLHRALAIGYLLRQFRPELRLGAARADGVLRAHAWLEIAGGVVGESPQSVAAFAPLSKRWRDI